MSRLLGQGGMGAVYLAENLHLRRREAIKVLLPSFASHPEAVRRFSQEALAASKIRHPGIVEVRDFSQLPDGTYYMTMEYVEGRTLRQHLREHQRLSLAETVALIAPLADAVHAAHQVGIAHRDIKPDNVLLPAAPAPTPVKLLDFGLAKLLRSAPPGQPELPQTVAGTVLGTPKYMAPEQARGDVHLTGPASDVYALGIILFECLAGHAPFVAPQFYEMLRLHNTAPPPPLRGVLADPAAARRAEALVQRCLAKDPQARPTSAALASELRALVSPPSATDDATRFLPPGATLPVRSLHLRGLPRGRPAAAWPGALALLSPSQRLLLLALLAGAVALLATLLTLWLLHPGAGTGR